MKKTLLYLVLGLLIVFECLRVYLIMPMPGSQNLNSIDLAYFLGSNKHIIRIVGFLLLINPIIYIFKNSLKKHIILFSIFGIIYSLIFYVFTFKMEADKMFYQPTVVSFSNISSNNIPTNKLIIGVDMDGVTKAYPIQLIGYHHQVRDTINNKQVMVTYCTVCRTGRVYSPIVNGKVETFRLVGMDHFNAMFEDATTKSWWRQSNGECIAGALKGYKLTEIKSEQVALTAWVRSHPNTLVLQPDEKFKEQFKGMDNYDKGNSKSGLTKRDTASWKDKSWVIGIQKGSFSKEYDWNQIVKESIIQDSIPNLSLLILIEHDSASFHTYSRKLNNETLHFSKNGDLIKDMNTGSLWNYDGVCIEGKLKGTVLETIPSYQEYLHSWEFFHPKTVRYLK